jgi:hypothetical protein
MAPYAIMSLINLLVNLFSPEYPCIFLVASPDMHEACKRGAVFLPVIAEIDTDAACYVKLPRAERSAFWNTLRILWGALVLLVALVAFFSPLIIVEALSRFEDNESTIAQRGWTVTWTVAGILIPGLLEVLLLQDVLGEYIGVKAKRLMVLGCIPTIGGMVVVGRMLNEVWGVYIALLRRFPAVSFCSSVNPARGWRYSRS